MLTLIFLPNLGMGASEPQEVVPATSSIGWTMSDRLPDWTMKERYADWTMPDRLADWTLSDRNEE